MIVLKAFICASGNVVKLFVCWAVYFYFNNYNSYHDYRILTAKYYQKVALV